MNYYIAGIPVSDELYHHGIKGQRWGIRRYQNPDGTLTEEGKQRYGTVENFNKSREDRKRKLKTALKVGAAAAGAAALGYGAYKYAKSETAKANAKKIQNAFAKVSERKGNRNFSSQSSKENTLSRMFQTSLSDLSSGLSDTVNAGRRAAEELSLSRQQLSRLYL